jgi:hypothetical protein
MAPEIVREHPQTFVGARIDHLPHDERHRQHADRFRTDAVDGCAYVTDFIAASVVGNRIGKADRLGAEHRFGTHQPRYFVDVDVRVFKRLADAQGHIDTGGKDDVARFKFGRKPLQCFKRFVYRLTHDISPWHTKACS